MRTTSRALTLDRLILPRRLVQRPVEELDYHALEIFYAIINSPLGFQEGDVLQFRCSEGWKRVITILGIEPDGFVDVMAYDGQPHYLPMSIDTITKLRVEYVERLPASAVKSYRILLGLDAEPAEEVAA